MYLVCMYACMYACMYVCLDTYLAGKSLQHKTRDTWNPGTSCLFQQVMVAQCFWTCILFSLWCWEAMPLGRIPSATRGSGIVPAGKDKRRQRKRRKEVMEEGDSMLLPLPFPGGAPFPLSFWLSLKNSHSWLSQSFDETKGKFCG